MSTTLEKVDHKTDKSQFALSDNSLRITHPKPDNITNPELQRIADDVLNAVRLSFSTIIAKPANATGSGSAEAALLNLLNQLPPEKRTTAQQDAKTQISSNQAAKGARFGRFADINFNKPPEGGFRQLLKESEPVTIDLTKFGLTVARVQTPTTDLKSLINPASFATLWGGPIRHLSNNVGVAKSVVPNTGKLQLILTSLRCNDETNPEWPSDDEMAVGGVTIGEKGVTTKIQESPAGKKYSDGVEQQLNLVFGEFSLAESPYWPKRFGAQLIIAEKDFGLFSAFLQTMWDEIGKAVLEAVGKAAEKAGVALAIFLQMPEFGPLIGLAIAAAAKWIVENLWKWLIDVFKDDIFTPAMVWVELQDMSSRWLGGSTSSPVMSETYSGFDGEYRLNYKWQLTGMPPIIEVPPVATGDDIQPGEGLGIDQSITSANGRFRLVCQGDGNIVLYDGSKPLWASNTWGNSVSFFVMQSDGNLIMRNADGQQVWASNTHTAGSKLVVQNDGNMVIYDPNGKALWASDTWQAPLPVLPPPVGRTIALKASVNNNYVTASDAGNSPLIANRSIVGPWEKFTVVDAGNGEIAIKAKVNGKFVTAENAGLNALIANRDVIGPWERFRWDDAGNGQIALLALVNKRYVTTEGAGISPLTANREVIGPWEKFVFELL